MGYLATFNGILKPPRAVKRQVDGKTLDVIDPEASEDGVLECTIIGGDQTKRGVHHSCQVTINGKPAKLGDLNGGDRLDIDGNPAVTIAASRAVK